VSTQQLSSRRRLAWLAGLRPGAISRGWAATGLAFAASAASVALMGVSAWLLSRAAEHPPVLYLQVAAVGVRFFGISRGVLRYVERLVGHDLALRMQSALRLETFQRLAGTTLLGARRGDLLARVIADVEAVQDLVVRVIVPALSASLVIVASTAMLGVFSPGSSAVLLVSAALAGGVVPWLAQQASRRADQAAVPTRGRLASAVDELSRTAADLVAYGAAGSHLARMQAIDEELRLIEARSAWIRGLATGAQVIAAGVAVIAALLIGGPQVASGSLPPVMLAVLVLTPLALHEVLSTLTLAAQTATRAQTALDRVHEVVTAEPIGAGDLPGRPDPAVRPHVKVRDAGIGWPGAPALVEGLSFEVGPGESVAVTGPSGAGKTTLAATILGLIPPRAGLVEVQGRIGYLAQDAHIFATSLAENVRIGNKDATDDDVRESLARAGLALEPGRVVGELGATLSGGEARRVALARLLVGHYQVFVLDEPTEHLDAETAAALLDDIWATAAATPMLVVTHDPAVIRRCDREVRLPAR
jgi:thiol reductant ABC exporter CydC subunit